MLHVVGSHVVRPQGSSRDYLLQLHTTSYISTYTFIHNAFPIKQTPSLLLLCAWYPQLDRYDRLQSCIKGRISYLLLYYYWFPHNNHWFQISTETISNIKLGLIPGFFSTSKLLFERRRLCFCLSV